MVESSDKPDSNDYQVELSKDDLFSEIRQLDSQISEIEEELDLMDEKMSKNSDLPDVVYEHEADLEQTLHELKRRRKRLRDAINTRDDVLRDIDIVSNAERLIDELESVKTDWEFEIEDAARTTERIKSTENRIDTLEQTAQSLVEETTSGALGSEFDDRRQDIEDELRKWGRLVGVTMAILIISAVGIYAEILLTDASLGTNISKVLLLLPITIAVWFSISNYNRRMKLAEEYEFKARMGKSLTAFREVLREDSPDEDVIAEFVSKSMTEIYSNPNQNLVEDDGEKSTSSGRLLEMLR